MNTLASHSFRLKNLAVFRFPSSISSSSATAPLWLLPPLLSFSPDLIFLYKWCPTMQNHILVLFSSRFLHLSYSWFVLLSLCLSRKQLNNHMRSRTGGRRGSWWRRGHSMRCDVMSMSVDQVTRGSPHANSVWHPDVGHRSLVHMPQSNFTNSSRAVGEKYPIKLVPKTRAFILAYL